MTRKHLELSAKLWSLALVAHTELSGTNSLADKVRHLSVQRATTRMGRLGATPGEVRTEADAIKVAQRILGTQH